MSITINRLTIHYPEVAKGMGDIAAGNLTNTEERLKVVDFASPDLSKGA